MATENEEVMAEGPGEEDGGESSNRTFMMLALGLGGLFIVGVICIVAIFFYQQNQRSAQVASATAMAAKNATVTPHTNTRHISPPPARFIRQREPTATAVASSPQPDASVAVPVGRHLICAFADRGHPAARRPRG